MFIDEWYDKSFYRDLPVGYRETLSFGQLFWTHAYYPHENLELWRPIPTPDEPTKTLAKEFQIQAAGKDALGRAYPLHVPKLATNEEFIVIRAKRRPVISDAGRLFIRRKRQQGLPRSFTASQMLGCAGLRTFRRGNGTSGV
jgi:hypothetical protein